MSAAIRIDYRLRPGPPGWAECDLYVEDERFAMGPFSGVMSTALDGLLQAALLVVTGAGIASFVFDGEPKPRWHWHLEDELPERRMLRVVVDVTDGMNENRSTLVTFRTSIDEFGRAVEAAAQALLETNGAAGYRARWGAPFPVRALAALEAALRVPE